MTKLTLIIATSFIVQLVYVKNTTPSSTPTSLPSSSIESQESPRAKITPEDQIKRIAENLTRAIDGHELVDDRYNAFKAVIDRIERNCKKVAFNSIIDRANITNADEIKADVDELYVNHIQNYPAQLKQAILERQVTQPIAQNAATAVRALCHQMLTLAKAKVKASKAKQQE